MDFEWDDTKAASNRRKHGVSFDEAKTVFGDPKALEIFDSAHSDEEERYWAIGISNRGRLLTVSFTRRDDAIRIISARKATSGEGNSYDQNQA